MQIGPNLSDQLIELCQEAAAYLKEAYETNSIGPVRLKEDKSPVTAVDINANNILMEGLARLTPNVPIISEEIPVPSFVDRKGWDHFWCIDPLDGTKEFLNRTGNFTLNLALISHGKSRIGFVAAPALDEFYFGELGKGAFEILSNGILRQISTKAYSFTDAIPRALVSRSHGSIEEKTIREIFPNCEIDAIGSSIKFCRVAKGEYDFYLRFRPTNEWDTAAAQCVLEAAGGSVTTLDGHSLGYNKSEIEQGAFLATCDDRIGQFLIKTPQLQNFLASGVTHQS